MIRPSRRAVLAAALLPAAARAASPAAKPLAALIATLDAIPAGPALLPSYPNATANAGFRRFALANDSAAYTYDNAVAGLALLAAGHGLRAARIADALALAQAHDPNLADGRLRNAYRAGAVKVPIALPGWWDARQKLWAEDPYQVGSETGPIAWAILLWAALRDAGVNSGPYDAAARRAAAWVLRHCRAKHGFTGGLFGYPPKQRKLLWISTEQNTDLAVAFGRLGETEPAALARSCVRAMYRPRGLFAAGLTPAGTPNRMIAADANLWPYLARLADASVVAPTIAALAQGGGIGFSSASHGLWTEGTAFAALALRRAGHHARADAFLATVRAQMAPDGYFYATAAPRLATGLIVGPEQDAPKFEYYRVPALAPTAWTILALKDNNPLRD